MPLNWSQSGPNNVPEYQLSGVPFVSSSINIAAAGVTNEDPAVPTTLVPTVLKFPFVTRWIQVTNMGTEPLRVGFTRNGVMGRGCGLTPDLGRNYFTLDAKAAASDGGSSTQRLELRCTELHFLSQHGSTLGKCEVVAGLTQVNRKQFPTLTGSTYTVATTVNRRDAAGNVVAVQIQAPLFASGSSGLG